MNGDSDNFGFSRRRLTNLSDGSENDVKSNGSSSSRMERRRVMVDRGGNRTKMKSRADKWSGEEDIDINGLSRVRMEKEFEDMKLQSGDEYGSRRSGNNPERYRGGQRNANGRRRYQGSEYSEVGPGNYGAGLSYSYGEPIDNRSEGRGYDESEYAGDDRAELLRKLDDLKDRLRRSGEIVDEPKGKVPHRSKIMHHDSIGSEDWFSDSSSSLNRPFVQFPVHNQHYAESSTYMNTYEMDGHRDYPPAYTRDHLEGVGDRLGSQMPRRGPPTVTTPAPFQHQPSHGYSSGRYPSQDMVSVDSFETYPPNLNQPHHMSCTCNYCHNENRVARPHISTDDRRLQDVPVFHRHGNSSQFGSRDFDPRITNTTPQLKSRNFQSHSRWPSDVDSEASSFVPRHPPKIQQSKGGRLRRCIPMAGGAPFFTCYNCFELLQVPKKVSVKYGNPKKLRCGACSTINFLGISNKRLVVSVHDATDEITAKVNNEQVTFASEDYNHSAYDFQSMDREHVSHLTDLPGSAKSDEIESLRSASSLASEGKAKLENLAASRKNSNPVEKPMKGKSPPPLASHGNRDSEQEMVMPSKTTPQQNYTKDVSEATEMEMLSYEYGNTGTSIESGEASREGNQLRAAKLAESLFAGTADESFRDDSSRSDQGEANVTVNGHLIPHRLIKKAEKLAGPIQHGHYWYDFRAGFWGVLGSPCLGVIPPFIEEFNYPILENCAGGNTTVYVNGRELHLKDLNLLASRGLPSERNRCYIIEISGRVIDEYTGQELDGLGKLAPSVERAKRGFGMKPPKAVV